MSIANILMRGLGAGASSLGASRFQEQEQRRREAAAEAQRLAVAAEQGEQRIALERERAAERERDAAEAAAVAKALGFKLPAGVNVSSKNLPLLEGANRARIQAKRDEAALERVMQGMKGRKEITGMNINARQPLIESQVNVNNARVPLLQAQTGNTNARTGQVGKVPPGKGDEAEYQKALREQIQKLMTPRIDSFGDMVSEGMPADEATMRAKRIVDAMYGRQDTPTEPPPARGANLMQGLGIGGGGGNSTPPLSPEDRARAQSDPAFARWLQSKGYRL
jgi:hypothetical protein